MLMNEQVYDLMYCNCFLGCVVNFTTSLVYLSFFFLPPNAFSCAAQGRSIDVLIYLFLHLKHISDK